MLLEKIKSEGLSHFSYILGDTNSGECVVIDPRRDVEVYLELAQENDVRITNILETHIHADFVSGSLELSHRTGAPISVGETAEVKFPHTPLGNGIKLQVGRLNLEVLHTPGHTPEHISFLVCGGTGADAPWGLFSGDILFAGEVGRPDLLGKDATDQLVHQLYKSLYQKILPLDDNIILYPAHGEGSPCGANIGERGESTLGYEKKHNPLLNMQSEQSFVKAVLASLSPAPSYYARMKQINAEGAEIIGALPHIRPLTPAEVVDFQQRPDAIIVDTREIAAFGGAHIPGSINIGLRTSFPIWAGEILDETFPIWAGRMVNPESDICLVLPDTRHIEEVQKYLLRIGHNNITGYLRRGIDGWVEAGHHFSILPQVSVHKLRQKIESNSAIQVLDVRTQAEFEKGHIPSAKNIYVPDLLENLDKLDQKIPVVTYCGSGYRASIAASILQREGFSAKNVLGSMGAWRANAFPETAGKEN